MTTVTTARILADKLCHRQCGPECIDWAVSMLEQGHDGHCIMMLAGMVPPFNSDEVARIRDRALKEIGAPDLDWKTLDIPTLEALLVEDPTLVDRAPDLDMNLLHLACSWSRVDLARVLLQRGASPNIEDGCGATPLELALRTLGCSTEGRVLLALLVEHGADPNPRPNPLLHLAVVLGHPPDAVRFLVGIGCDPNRIDGDDDPPWHFATLSQRQDGSHPPARIEQLRELLALGADPDLQNFCGNRLDQELTADQLMELAPDIAAARSRLRGS